MTSSLPSLRSRSSPRPPRSPARASQRERRAPTSPAPTARSSASTSAGLSQNAFLYRFTVARQVKGKLPKTIGVVSGTDSASCGLQVRKGKRVALLLHRVAGRWHSSLCDQRGPNFFRGIPSRMLASCG